MRMCTSPNWPRPPALLLVPIASLGVMLHRFAIGNFRLLRFHFHLVAAFEPFAKDHASAIRSCRSSPSPWSADRGRGGRSRLPRRSCAAPRRAWLRRRELFGMAARPTIGVGNLIGGMLKFPSVAAGVQIFDLGDRPRSPRPRPIRSASFRSPCTSNNGPIFRFLFDARNMHGFILLHRAAEHAKEAELLHERIDAGLEHLRHQRPGRIGFHFDFLAGVVRGLVDDLVGR